MVGRGDLFFRSEGSRPGHFSRVCVRGKAPPPCSRLRCAPASQGLPQPQRRKWHGPPAVTAEEAALPFCGEQMSTRVKCVSNSGLGGWGEEENYTNTGDPLDFVCSIHGNKSRASGEGGSSGKATEQVARHRLATHKKMEKRTTALPYRYPDRSRRAEGRQPISAQIRLFRNVLGCHNEKRRSVSPDVS